MKTNILYKLIIDTDRALFDPRDPRIKKANGSIAPVSIVKDAILKVLRAEGAHEKNPDLWGVVAHGKGGSYTLPIVHYAHPISRGEGANEIHIFGRGDLGLEALEFIRDGIEGKILDLGRKRVKIEGMGILQDYAAIPIRTSNEGRKYFRTVTPIVLFSEKSVHKEWKSITLKYMHSDPDIYIDQMRGLIERRLREELSAQVRDFILDTGGSESDFVNTLGRDPEDFADLEVESFFIYPGRCQENRTSTALLRVVFSTEWNIPQFLGKYSDLGFGMIKPADPARAATAYDPLLMVKKDMRKTNRVRKAS